MKIDLESIKKLSENLNKYNLTEATLEMKDIKLTIKKEIPKVETVYQEIMKPVKSHEMIHQNHEVIEAVPEENNNYETIDSPMVGTFYRAPAPGAEPFVKEGQEIKAGDILCIVEAMKLMNEVKAVKNCRIEKILAEEGKVVKKGDTLFLIS